MFQKEFPCSEPAEGSQSRLAKFRAMVCCLRQRSSPRLTTRSTLLLPWGICNCVVRYCLHLHTSVPAAFGLAAALLTQPLQNRVVIIQFVMQPLSSSRCFAPCCKRGSSNVSSLLDPAPTVHIQSRRSWEAHISDC